MIKLELSPEKFMELTKKGYDLNIVFMLKMLEKELMFEEIHQKIDTLAFSIRRKGLSTEDGKLTPEGQQILDFLVEKDEKVKLVKKKPKDENFTLWWSHFPGTDSFKIGNKEFVGTRALKAKKEDCREKLNKIMSEGEYTITEMIQALELEVHQKKQNSIKTGGNKLSYMTNSLSYLNGRLFEPFIELVRAGHKVKEENKTLSGGVDI